MNEKQNKVMPKEKEIKMKRRIVKSQADFEKYIGSDIILIIKPDTPIVLKGNDHAIIGGNSYIELRDSANAIFLDNAYALLRDHSYAEFKGTSHARLMDNSYGTFWDKTHAQLMDSSYAVLRDHSYAELKDTSHATLKENSQATLLGNSYATLIDDSYANLGDTAHAALLDNAHAVLKDNSHVELNGTSHAMLWDSSCAILWDTSYAELKENSQAIALDNSFVLVYDKNTVRLFGNASSKEYIRPVYDKSTLERLAEKTDDGLVLYKSVDPNTDCDFHSGKVHYEIGEIVECPDWSDNPEIQCGNGLHLCFSALTTQRFNPGKILKCVVKPEDIVVFPYNISKVRCKKVKPIVVVDISGREI